MTFQHSFSQSCGSLHFLFPCLPAPLSLSQIFSCLNCFISSCYRAISMFGAEGLCSWSIVLAGCIGLLWYAQRCVWCCVGGKRCVTLLNLTFGRLGHSVVTVLYIFIFLLLRAKILRIFLFFTKVQRLSFLCILSDFKTNIFTLMLN